MSTRRLRSKLSWRADGVHFEVPAAAHERAVQLLHVGAEIEHALMVQYLYAGYSLDPAQPSEEKRTLVKAWRAALLEIAREEMGHLATVQNLLTSIGGPLSFEREDYPIVDAELWPFPLKLEPLTKDSLARYVLAEMPAQEVLVRLGLAQEIAAIERRVAATGAVHRVGLLYGELLTLFTAGPMIQGPHVTGTIEPYPFVATADIQADSLPFQVHASAWGLGAPQILIETAWDRASALAALTKVSMQGEGPIVPEDIPATPPPGVAPSHFKRFLEIYRAFPEQSDWSPSRPIATDPTTAANADASRRITDVEALGWAKLANLRYRMLLAYLKHSFYIQAPSGHPTRSPRGALVSWAFGEMYQLRSIAEILMSLPLGPGDSTLAGPPFEMPYTLSLPQRSGDRWRLHRDLLLASCAQVRDIQSQLPSRAQYLRALTSADLRTLEQIDVLIGA